MNVTRLAAFIMLAVACGVATAQSYSIRISYNTNLRAAASLQAQIVETAPAGATLSVVGSSNRWLRISRNENDVWMASWVGHTRVADAGPTQTQTTSNIDNCCFVDRQCQSDQEWVDGYWAFQNGQCAAPVQTQTSSPTQTMVNVAADFNNCCDLGWQCATDAQWQRGFLAFSTNQCKHPGAAIEGSPAFIARIEATLDLLKQRAPSWYEYVLTGLATIQEVPPRQGGAWVWLADARTEIPTSWAFPDSTLEFILTRLASSLAHEACHVHRHLGGVEPLGLIGETACLEVEIASLQAVAASDKQRLRWLREILANIHDPAYQWWH